MGRLHIRRVTLQAFRAFQDKQSTPQLPRNGLVGIRGHVSENGGSSGAGKSSVAYAIAYAFGFCPFPASQQQNWHTKLPMQVELELETDQGTAILRRGKEFSLTVGGQTYSGAAKSVEAELRRLIGIPTSLLEALTYRQQQQRGRFLTMTDAEKKEFLGTLLGSQEIEEQISAATKSANALQTEIGQLSEVVKALETEIVEPTPPILQSEDSHKTALTELEAKMAANESVRKLLNEEYAAWLEQMEAGAPVPAPFVPPENQGAVLQKQKAECNDRITKASDAERQAKAELYAQATALNPQISSMQSTVSMEATLAKAVSQLLVNIRALEASKCPTCEQSWAKAQEQLAVYQSELQAKQASLRDIEEVKPRLAALIAERDSKLAEWNAYKSPTLEKLAEIRSMLDKQIAAESAKASSAKQLYDAEVLAQKNAYIQSYAASKQEKLQRISAVNADSVNLATEIRAADAAIEGVKRYNTAVQDAYARELDRSSRLKGSIEKKQIELYGKSVKAAEEADYAQALKSYLGSLFDEVLAQISAETNELLKAIPNTPTTTVTFTSETITQKGTAKQEIKPVIIKNGQAVDLKSGISGGQLESVELAVDLSIAKVIGQRTGVKPGFMIFDESFSAHCLPVKEACLQVLQRAADDAMILVIDHATELREYFSTFIDVFSERDISRFGAE